MYKETLPEDVKQVIWAALFIFVCLALFIVFFSLLFNNRKNKLIKEKKMMEEKFKQELLQTQLEIQEQTLKTISQEIHDNVGQVLSLAKLNLNTLNFSEGADKQLKIENSISLVGKAINDLRDLSRSMNGDKIADLGLQEAIENELKIIQNTGQFTTNVTVAGTPYKLKPQNEMVIFRIVQESLNNILKHSKAQNILADIDYEPDIYKLFIRDDGEGFDSSSLKAGKTGIGLKNMESRAALIGAKFSIESAANKGTTVVIHLPKQPS
jgi:two-component system, NarL family, sensor kinase